VVLNIAVWGAVLAYLLQMASFVILRVRFPEAKRPHLSPFGVPGAVVAGLISAVVFVGVLLNPSYTAAIYTVLVLYVLALVFFAVRGRHNLILSPEEEYAISEGIHAKVTQPEPDPVA
jgi:ethanolamine permease